jgi:hypothetical protein
MGPDSVLAANGNLCTQTLFMPTTITAQDGAQIKRNTRISYPAAPSKPAVAAASGSSVTESSGIPSSSRSRHPRQAVSVPREATCALSFIDSAKHRPRRSRSRLTARTDSSRRITPGQRRTWTPHCAPLSHAGKSTVASVLGEAARAASSRALGRPARSPAQPNGEGGMRVWPRTPPIRRATSSGKHHDQVSPGSSERISGCPLSCACARAWRLGESSQQPTLPHSRQIRRCSHRPPLTRQSSQPSTASGS